MTIRERYENDLKQFYSDLIAMVNKLVTNPHLCIEQDHRQLFKELNLFHLNHGHILDTDLRQVNEILESYRMKPRLKPSIMSYYTKQVDLTC